MRRQFMSNLGSLPDRLWGLRRHWCKMRPATSSSWLLLALPGSSWLLQAPPGSS